MPEIAINIVCKDDPIKVDTHKILAALADHGYNTTLVDIDWANATEWRDVTDPGRVSHGRHSTDAGQFMDEDYRVRWYHGAGGGFVREFVDEDRELEDVR